MQINHQEVDRSTLPQFYTLKGNHDVYMLKATRYGMQLIKVDSSMQHLLTQQ